MLRLNLILALILISATLAYPIEFRTGDRVIVTEGDTIASDLFVGTQYLDMRGYVDGDLVAGSERITVDGDVRDDIRAAGREIVLRGTTGDGVIGFGQTILLDGTVEGDVIAFGGEVRLSGTIKGNLYLGCGVFYLEGGRVDGKIEGSAKDAKLNGQIGGSVRLEGHTATFSEGYVAAGGTFLTLDREPGPELQVNAPDNLEIKVIPKKPFYQTMFFYWAFASAFVFGLIIILFFKNFVRNYLVVANKQLGLNLGVGFLILIATPVAVVILLILVLTIPTALVLTVLYIFMLYASSLIAAVVIGDYIQSLFYKSGERLMILSLLIGMIITTLLVEVPYAGWLFSLVILCFGMGSFSRFLWGLRKQPVREEN